MSIKYVQRNIGVFILEASCVKIGGELSGTNCPGGELCGYRSSPLVQIPILLTKFSSGNLMRNQIS